MTTGYTQVLIDKPETTFADFALRCGRAFGYLVHLREAEARRAEENRLFSEMLAQVEAWEPPTPNHEALKKFMAEQLTMSMHRPVNWPVHRMSGRTWLGLQRENAAHDLRRASDDWERDLRRAREGTKWLADLRESVGEGASR